MLPREKFSQRGIDSLTDSDLVSILVGSGIKGKDFSSVSKSVIKKFRTILQSEKEIYIQDLTNISGVGEVTAMRILSGIELGKRLYGLNEKKERIMTSEQAYMLLKDIGTKKKEYVIAVFLNSRFEVIKKETICIGSLDGVGIVPRDILIPALESNAGYVVIAHNHPSGDATPSKEDIVITKRISEALDLVGLRLIDHLVISNTDWKCIDF
jgi:DNA repair protein RadC